MIKKLFTLVLLLGVSIFITRSVYAYEDGVYIHGIEWVIDDIGSSAFIEWEYEYNSEQDKLYIMPTEPELVFSQYAFNISGEEAFDYIMNTTNLDSYEAGVEIPLDVGFVINLENNAEPYPLISDYYSHLVIEIGSSIYYIDLIFYNLENSVIEIKFEYVIYLDNDGVHNFYSDAAAESFYNNLTDELLYDRSTDNWNVASIYFENNYVDENKWVEYDNIFYWSGYTTDPSIFITPTQPFTENYFVKYVNDVILPYANSESHGNDLVTDYVTRIRNEGIVIDLTPNFSLYLFVSAFWLDAIDPWYELAGTYETVIITMPDLIKDGNISTDINGNYFWNGEIWGKTIVYDVDGVTYPFGMVNDFNNEIPPLISLRINTVAYLVSFNTTGGVAVDPQWVESGGYATYVTPTRPNYVFWHWNKVSVINPIVPFNANGLDYDLVINFDNYPILSNTTFYALWKREVKIVTLNFNGGTYAVGSGMTNNLLPVEYNRTVSQNTLGVNFNSIPYRANYNFAAWYIDSELTTQFNTNTPITEDITLYARWTVTPVNPDAPPILFTLLDNFNLYNTQGFIIIYIIIVVILFTISLWLRLPIMVMIIELILLTALYMWLGWFSLWILIIIFLSITLGVIIEVRRN